MSFLFSFGNSPLVSLLVSQCSVSVRLSEPKNGSSTSLPQVASPAKKSEPKKQRGQNSLVERLLPRILPRILVRVVNVQALVSCPSLSHVLVAGVGSISFEIQSSGRSLSGKPLFLPTLNVSEASLSWRFQNDVEELIKLTSISCSVPLEASGGTLAFPQTSLLDFAIERITSQASLGSFLRLQHLAVAAAARKKQLQEVEEVNVVSKEERRKEVVAMLSKIEFPKIRVRLPLIAIRIRCQKHSLNVDSDITCNFSISAKTGPLLVTGEVSINATIDAAPLDRMAHVSPLARLSGLHCFLQSSVAESVSTFDLKLTTTGIIFNVVPDHARVALSIVDTVHANMVTSDKTKKKHADVKPHLSHSTTELVSGKGRIHVSASLNSIVVQLSEERDRPPVVSVRLETPSISVIGGGGPATVIMQSTFLEMSSLAYQSPLALEVMPLSDKILNIEALALRGDSSELGITSKSVSVQLSPELLESMLPIVSALPLADLVERQAAAAPPVTPVVTPLMSKRLSSPAPAVVEESGKPKGPAILVRVGGDVQLHLVDLRSNNQREAVVISLLSSDLELTAAPKSQPTLKLKRLDGITTRYRPTDPNDVPKTFPAFFSCTNISVDPGVVSLDDLSVVWNPEFHFEALELGSSFAVCAISYVKIIPRLSQPAIDRVQTRQGGSGSLRTVPLAQRKLPALVVNVTRFSVKALLGVHSAMRVTMDLLVLKTNPVLGVEFTNAVYAVGLNHVDIRQILRVPSLTLSLMHEPRSIVAAKVVAVRPRWVLPYKFDFGSIVDETATVAKCVAQTSAALLRNRQLIPPAQASARRRAMSEKEKEEADEGDEDDEDSVSGGSSSKIPVSSRSKPPRFVISCEASVIEPVFELADNPFEVRLATAYRVRVDELAEIAIREEILLRRLSKLRRNGNLSDQAHEALLAALARENTRIYIRRVRAAIENAPTYVHRISSPGVTVGLGIDVRPLRLKKRLRRLNKQSRFFPLDYHYCFELLVGLRATLKAQSVTLQHRDLPNPWVDVSGVNLDLNVVIAEDLPRPESEIHWTVLASSTRRLQGVRTSTGVKIYHDIKLRADSLDYVMGKAYDWYQKAFVQSFALMVPENAYSQRLCWWDKMRHAFHGLLNIQIATLRWRMTGTLNPYDVANFLLLAGSNVVFSYKTNELKLSAELFQASVSTISTPFLSSKDFQLIAGMKWESLGDPDDHLCWPVASYQGPYVVDASDETNTPRWNEQLKDDDPDPFAMYRATNMKWDFDLRLSPPAAGGEIVTLDNALFNWFMRYGKVLTFPEMYIQPPIFVPVHPGFFGPKVGALNLRLRATNFNIAYWESREVRDPVGFKMSVSVLDVLAGMERDRKANAWTQRLSSLKADGLESLMFPSEDYTRFYDAIRGTGNEALQFPGTPFLCTPTLLLVPETLPNGRTMQRFTVIGLRATYTPAVAGLISSWRDSYAEWSNQEEATKLESEMKKASSSSAGVGNKGNSKSNNSSKQNSTSNNRGSVNATTSSNNSNNDEEGNSNKNGSATLARMVSEHLNDAIGDAFFEKNGAPLDHLVEVKDAQIKLVTIVPEGAALLVAENLEVHVGLNAKEQRLIRVIWKEYELYCSERIDLWLDRRVTTSVQLPRILTKCSMEFDILNSPANLVQSGGAEAKGSLAIIAPGVLAHMNANHFNILRAVFSKFFVVQTSMSEQHKDLLATIQYKLQLAPESVGDILALRNRVRSLGVEIKDLQSKIHDLETESVMGNMSPVLARRKNKNKKKQNVDKSAPKACQHCGEPFVIEAECVEVEEAFVHAKCVVDYRTSLMEPVVAQMEGKGLSRTAMLRQRLVQKQRTFQASTELLNMLIECQKKVLKGASALPSWKLSVRVEQVQWHLMNAASEKGKEDIMFCEALLKNLTASIVLREDESGTIRMEVNRVSILNHTPQTDGKYLHALQPLKASKWSDRDVMIRVFAAMRSPVGGIQVYDHFEFNVTPLRVSITGDLFQSIFDYIFLQKEQEKEQEKRLAKKATLQEEADLASRHFTDFNITSSGEVFYCYDETDYVKMRLRAETNRMFIYWKLTDVALLLTFRKGFAFENLKLILHSKEYRTLAGSWNNLVSSLKNDVLKDVLGQTGNFLKHAFTPKSQRAEDIEDVALRPKSKLQLKLDGLARATVGVVTFGKVNGRERVLEEERMRVQQQLQDTLRQTQSSEASTQNLLDQIDLPDEILLGNAQKREMDDQIYELKTELLMGNLAKREQERDRLKKKKKREKDTPKAVAEDAPESPTMETPPPPSTIERGRRKTQAQSSKPAESPLKPESPLKVKGRLQQLKDE